MVRRLLPTLVVVALAWTQTGYKWYWTVCDPTPDAAGHVDTTCDPESTHPVRWYKDSVPVWTDQALTADVPGQGAYTAVQASLATWNALACPHARLDDQGLVSGRQPTTTDSNGHSRGSNLVLWEDAAHWNGGVPTADRVIALTTLYYSKSTGIADSFSLELNDSQFDFTLNGDVQRLKTDIQNTVTHELGHALGLDHSADKDATMYLSAGAGDIKKRTLKTDDKDGLCNLYAQEWVTPPDDGGGGGGCASGGGGWPGLAACAVALIVVTLGLRRQRRRDEERERRKRDGDEE